MRLFFTAIRNTTKIRFTVWDLFLLKHYLCARFVRARQYHPVGNITIDEIKKLIAKDETRIWLLISFELALTLPDRPSSRYQKYQAIGK